MPFSAVGEGLATARDERGNTIGRRDFGVGGDNGTGLSSSAIAAIRERIARDPGLMDQVMDALRSLRDFTFGAPPVRSTWMGEGDTAYRTHTIASEPTAGQMVQGALPGMAMPLGVGTRAVPDYRLGEPRMDVTFNPFAAFTETMGPGGFNPIAGMAAPDFSEVHIGGLPFSANPEFNREQSRPPGATYPWLLDQMYRRPPNGR